MSDLQARFAQAQQDVNALAELPDNNTMLTLYALYKQATQGDATGEEARHWNCWKGRHSGTRSMASRWRSGRRSIWASMLNRLGGFSQG
jgi:acyl-CoA-binding protein